MEHKIKMTMLFDTDADKKSKTGRSVICGHGQQKIVINGYEYLVQVLVTRKLNAQLVKMPNLRIEG